MAAAMPPITAPYDGAGIVDGQGEQESGQKREDDLGAGREVGTRKKIAAEHLLDGLRVRLDAGHRRIERRRADIEQAGSAGANEDNFALHCFGRDSAFEDGLGRDVASRSECVKRSHIWPLPSVGTVASPIRILAIPVRFPNDCAPPDPDATTR